MSKSFPADLTKLIRESVEIIKSIGNKSSNDMTFTELLRTSTAYNLLRLSRSTSEDSQLLQAQAKEISACRRSYGKSNDETKGRIRSTLVKHIDQGRQLVDLSDFHKEFEKE